MHQLTKGPPAQPLPRELTETIRTARAQQQDGTWQRDYALRAGVESAIRQATHTTGLRRARYRALAKTHLDHTTSATALNLIRLNAWWNGPPGCGGAAGRGGQDSVVRVRPRGRVRQCLPAGVAVKVSGPHRGAMRG
ncbi:transposase [Streptomyces sp. NPDC057580]|uniref:transposase n=1 Tax=Streptomyces sp. NPDC057580 TaxID=3346173 RepID=UPI00369D2845